MADNNSVSVSVRINGKDAENELSRLKQEVDSLRTAFIKAGEAGDRAMAEKFRKEVVKTEAKIRQMESGVKACQRVFAQLDKASPADLQRALKFLNSELKNIERGSAAWTAQTEKIRRVKAELDKVNAELRQSEGMFARMKNTVNDWGASIAAGAAAIAGLVAAGKAAVEAYAEMDQEMANVRKYTGMTAEQVDHLNEEFKKMDTRTSREALNQLAQEAGRLGKQSEEDVLGFVRAADKINVALDDLGEGATLTLSKLTSIFGDEERLGTERSLLAVGSVINELSQNSTASAPYLAEFAQRLAGVGAQAHMTIPEIMGFAAVLDSQGQKLEMSSTAVSKIIMNLFKSPEKIAKATGMAVTEFAETCKRSTNEGLLMLLNRLHELGGIDTLAPVFADMGENGARASAVLAALAGNVDMVRQQQEAANVAFQEAISIDKEFTVQNTTVQADLEKKKKIFREHAVELGEKLLPVMGHFHSSTSMSMKALSIMIDYVIEYKGALITLAAAIAGYTVAVKTTVAIEKLYNGIVLIGNGLKHAQRVAVLASSLAYNKLAGHTTRAAAAQKLLNATMKTNPWGLLASAITAAVAGLIAYHNKQKEISATDKAMKEIQGSITSQYAEQKGKIDMLLSTLENERNSLKKRKAALEELRKIVPSYHAELTNEGKLIRNNKKAIDDYLTALNKKIAMQAYEEKLAEQYRKKAELEMRLEDEKKTLDKAKQDTRSLQPTRYNSAGQEVLTWDAFKQPKYIVAEQNAASAVQGTQAELVEIEKTIGQINTKMEQFASTMQVVATEAGEVEDEVSTVVPGAGDNNEGGSGDSQPASDPLKALEAEYQKKQAIETYYYAMGQKSYSEHIAEKKRLEAEYHQDRLALMTEGTTEYYQEYAAIEQQKRNEEHAQSLEDQKYFYEEEKRCINEQYANGKITHQEYTRWLEEAELDYLDNVVRIYEEGSDEYIDAMKKFQQREFEIQKKRFDENKKLEDQIKKLYFTEAYNTSDNEEYSKSLAALDVVYAQLSAHASTNEELLKIDKAYHEAKYALAKEYNQTETMETLNAYRAMGDKIADFFQSDMGKNIKKGFDESVNQMRNLFSGLTSFIESDVKLQTETIENEYDKRIESAGKESAEGERLEQEKKDKIAKINADATKKKFNIQVIETVATGIQSAVEAWSAGWQLGAAGVVMAPLFMAMSLAATGFQIGALKKQRDAALAQGYAPVVILARVASTNLQVSSMLASGWQVKNCLPTLRRLLPSQPSTRRSAPTPSVCYPSQVMPAATRQLSSSNRLHLQPPSRNPPPARVPYLRNLTRPSTMVSMRLRS